MEEKMKTCINKKANALIFMTLIIIAILITLSAFFLFCMKISASEEVKISLKDGLGYTSNIETDNELNLRLWLMGGVILKILIGIAVVIIAIAILTNVLNKKRNNRQNN